jgi:hypothetical protein
MIAASDMQALLSHLPPPSQTLAHELYVLDLNVCCYPESCYSLPHHGDSQTEAAYVLRSTEQILNFSEKADALQKSLRAAACTRWDLTSDEDGRFITL